MKRKLTFLWFMMGFCYKLQLVASLSITEVAVLILAPIVFFKDFRQMRRDGVFLFLILSLLVIVGCIVGAISNSTPFQEVLRGLATTVLISESIVVSHWMLCRDPNGFRWFLLALPISAILSTFIFKEAVEVATLGESSEEIMEGPLFWISRLSPLVMAPTKGWYLQTPGIINVFAPLFVAIFSMLTTISGRSAALGAVGFASFVLIGRKSRKSMSLISRHFGLFCIFGICLISAMYLTYRFSAVNGLLGEEARKKYEMQTAGGEGGVARLLLGGRGDSFIGLLACRDKPIFGWGPWARDTGGWTEEFMSKYGTVEDYENLMRMNEWNSRHGFVGRRLLSCHSYITQFWAWYGIFGLVFWVYVVYVLIRYLKEDLAAVPQWYGWLACSIPSMLWAIFFSPFAERFGFPLMIVACLMARSVRTGRYQLPADMLIEIDNAERK